MELTVNIPAERGQRLQHLSDLRRWMHYNVPVIIDGQKARATVYGGIPRRSNGRLFLRVWFGKQRWSGWTGKTWNKATLTPSKAL